MLPKMDRYHGSDPFVVFSQAGRVLTFTERLHDVPGIVPSRPEQGAE